MMHKKLGLLGMMLVLVMGWGGARPGNAAQVELPGVGPGVQADTLDPMSGTWEFGFGTMTLTQKGPRVTGTYQWYGGGDTGRITGTFLKSLNQFHGLWISDKSFNIQGFLRLRLAADGSGFSGTFERGNSSQPWCGVRAGRALPADCGFSGAWQLRFGNPPGVTGQAFLVQTGPVVTGTYTTSEGVDGEIVEGLIVTHSLSEARLEGTWRNVLGEQDSLDWRLNLTNGETFQGRRDPGNSDWCGWRDGVEEPRPCGWDD